MTTLSVRFQDVSFQYERMTAPAIKNLSVHFATGWAGIVGANGVGKSTILKLATGMLRPQTGQVLIPELALYCRQRTDNRPDKLHELIHATDSSAFRIKGQLGLESDWPDRWETLSHGERKRAQIAVALWQEPQVLAIDEPTNHLDTDAQSLLFDALADFHGVGLLVSHDRRLLNDLCRHCLFIEPPHAVLRPGSYTQGLHQAQREELTAQREKLSAKEEYARLRNEASKRRDAASQADRKRSKRGLDRKDHDAKAKINAARVTGKDGVAGKRLNQLSGHLARAQAKVESVKVKKNYSTAIWLPGGRSKRDTLFQLPAGSLALGANRRLNYPDLSMKPNDRIAITGSNGCGKSSLIGVILQSLDLEKDRLTYLPQEIGLSDSQAILSETKKLPREQLGRMMTVVSCLGSRPERLLESSEPSPGEVRKMLLATGIAKTPHLIVMDEPTNHLDLPSIESLESALVDCPCGLLLVSHDRDFLDALADTRWHITEDSEATGRFVLHVSIRG